MAGSNGSALEQDLVCVVQEFSSLDVMDRTIDITIGSPKLTDVNQADHQSEDDRKLFVGGLSWEITTDDLDEYFSRFGKVTQSVIKLNRLTGNSRGFGFVTMENEECVSKVLNESEHWLKNKKIDPKKAKPTKEPLKKVFVGGIDPLLSEEQIKEYFSTFGKVESLDLPFDTQKNRRKHYIFVSFETEAAAKKAIAKERQEIFGRQCDVRVALTRDSVQRHKNIRPCYGWYDPNFIYHTLPMGYSSMYSGYDPYFYHYYGYGFYPATADSASQDYSTIGVALNTHALSGGNPNASSTVLSNHHPGLPNQQPQQQQDSASLNFWPKLLASAQTTDHYSSLPSEFDFGAHQNGPGMAAGAGTTFTARP